MGKHTGFTQKVRELLREEPRSSKEIMQLCRHLTTKPPSEALYLAKDIHHVGRTGLCVYYIEDEKKAREKLEKLRSENRQKYHLGKLPLNPKIEMAIDMFTGFDLELSATDVWKERGGHYGDVRKALREYEKSGVLIGRKEGRKKYYRLNPDNPCSIIADGQYVAAERQLLQAVKKQSKILR